jgi:transposase
VGAVTTDDPLEAHGRDGYALVRSSLPADYHAAMEGRIDRLSCPGNNLLAEIPELIRLFDDPPVKDALDSILHGGWLLEPHRHAHVVGPGEPGVGLHHDEFAGRPWTIRPPGMGLAIVFYYPQDVGDRDGPTVVVPGSHRRIDEWPDTGTWPTGPDGDGCVPLLVPAGTVAVLDGALVHGSRRNHGSRRRRMVKFLCSDMRPPAGPARDPDRFLEEIGDPDPNVRAAAVLDAARHATRLPTDVLRRVAPLLDDPDRYVQAYAAEALRRSGHPCFKDVLLEWLWPRRWDPRTTSYSPF